MSMGGVLHNGGKGPGQAGLGVGKPTVAWLLRVCGSEKATAVKRGWGQAREVQHSPGGNGEPRTSLRARESIPHMLEGGRGGRLEGGLSSGVLEGGRGEGWKEELSLRQGCWSTSLIYGLCLI